MTDAAGTVDMTRALFAFSTEFHYLFVPLTIGLMAVIASLEAVALYTRKAVWAEAALFWGRFFLVNFVCGVLTGWPLRHHLQAQWGHYTEAAGEVLTYIFSLEGRLAPVLFGLVLIFALRRRLPLRWRLGVSAALAAALIAQSVAILALNAWMQNPDGIVWAEGRWHLPDPSVLFANPLLPSKLLHTLAAAYVLGGMFVTGLSAWLLLRARRVEVAQSSIRVSAFFTLVALLTTALAGHRSGEQLVHHQPAKFAAIEGLWRPSAGREALTVFALPDAASRSNRFALEIPGALAWIAGSDQPLPNLQDIERQTRDSLSRALALRAVEREPARSLTLASYQASHGVLSLLDTAQAPSDAALDAAARRALPPVAAVFWGFRVMVGAWVVLMVVVGVLSWCGARPDQRRGRVLLWACLCALPFAWIANMAGWMVCEMGRQPWTITGVLSTLRSHSVAAGGVPVWVLLGWGAAYACVAVANVTLSLRWLRPAPVAATVAAQPVVVQPAVVRLSGREKRRLVAAACRPGASVEQIARAHRISVRRLQRWIRTLEVAGKLPGPQECY
ncbi:cytochrome ubiquinol oxidase subunit I [Roseateles sp. BYS96W]|uniref:Cytochrome ubiquinol oxidase subunit I n=1 Tax=Pelomonas nitida TaxID=3299027 RepID=A0ABW7G973_9BURK